MDAQPRHAAVGIDVEAQVRKRERRLDREFVFAVAAQLGLREDLEPVRQVIGLRLETREACLD